MAGGENESPALRCADQRNRSLDDFLGVAGEIGIAQVARTIQSRLLRKVVRALELELGGLVETELTGEDREVVALRQRRRGQHPRRRVRAEQLLELLGGLQWRGEQRAAAT